MKLSSYSQKHNPGPERNRTTAHSDSQPSSRKRVKALVTHKRKRKSARKPEERKKSCRAQITVRVVISCWFSNLSLKPGPEIAQKNTTPGPTQDAQAQTVEKGETATTVSVRREKSLSQHWVPERKANECDDGLCVSSTASELIRTHGQADSCHT